MILSSPQIAPGIRIFFALIFTLGSISGKGQLHINEFQASNISTILDPSGNYREWVEIYNSGNATVNLEGYFLSTDLSNPFYRKITSLRINAKSFAIIWLDKSKDDPCCKFQLEMHGGAIGLFSPSGELIDSVSFQRQYLNVAYGRSPDGSDKWSFFDHPTPAASNQQTSTDLGVLTEAVHFSLEGGFYQGSQLLELSTLSGQGVIRYTNDGTWPTSSSAEYTDPIPLIGNSVIQAKLYQTGMIPGPVTTKSYILNDSSSLPVVSIVSDATHFFSKQLGIYVKGSNGITGRCMDEPANWNRDWERPANIEYFTKEGVSVINQVVGIRIFGACSRIWNYKSLAVIARHKYGDNSLSYNFFNTKEIDEFKSLILRNSGGDAYYSMLRDGFMHSLLQGNIDVDCQGYQPANVFINGEYWGILNVREKINEHYAASNYDIDSDNIDLIERERYLKQVAVHGSTEHYEDLINYISENSLSNQTNFEYVKTQMDVNEFMNYCLTEIYFGNIDWPANNKKYWRPHIEGGKWRWLLYDTDASWGLHSTSNNSIEEVTSKGQSRPLNALLDNQEFRDEFIQRMAGFINTTFSPAKVTPLYDSLKAQLDKEIHRHILRWNRPYTATYEEHTEEIIPHFTQERPGIVRNHVSEYFGLSGLYALSSSVNDPSKGYIKASGVSLPDGFSGLYFKDIPLSLEAFPCSGYKFSHWEGAVSSGSESVRLTVSKDAVIRAVFAPDNPANNVYINEVCASNTLAGTDNYGQNEDWIEIYNDNDFDVNLAGWYLSDSSDHATKFQIPFGHSDLTTARAKGYLILWCDKDTRQGPLHCDLKLRKEGELLTLSQKIEDELHLVDSLRFPELQTNLTYGRLPDTEKLVIMAPTPLNLNEEGLAPELFINEWMTRNCGIHTDEFDEADDWIEVYNPTSDTIDLGGLYLTDSLQNPLKYKIPSGNSATTIPPYGYKILWADNQPDQGVLHLGFKLDGKTEQIGLFKLGVGFLDSLSYNLEQSGMAMGRYGDGSDLIQKLSASPGESNLVQAIENIYINEFMARNYSTATDLSGEYDDWIEIYNHNDFDVDIGGLFITDSLSQPSKHRIPTCQSHLTTIPAKGFIILWADGQEEQGALHLDFKLSGDGEQIGLVQVDGITFIDTLSYRDIWPDMAIGRLEDGSSHMQVLSPSPGYQNHATSVDGLFISELSASGNNTNPDNSGEYDDWIEVYNHNDFAVDIGGLFITDSLNHLSKYRIPSRNPDSTTIAAKEYLILWADNQPEQGVNHLGFKLNGKGEQVVLVDMDCQGIIDSVSFPDQHSNFTFSRTNNTGSWRFLRPTYCAYNSSSPLSGIRINEFMASNSGTGDSDSERSDWIELYNANDFPVDIGGLYLTDTIGDPSKYRIPSHSPELTTILPKCFFIFYADDEKGLGLDHTNFKLSRKGEAVLLFHYDGSTVLDSVTYSKQYKNSATGRILESGNWWVIPPTPGASNVVPDVSGLVINEVMGNNKTTCGDEYDQYDDWIELYNSSDEPLDVGGLYLSDSLANPTLFRISSECSDSTTIPPKGHLILWGDNSVEQGILHLGFKISKTGETIGVFNYTEELIDSVSYPFISPNLSWGRITDAYDTWMIFDSPTPQMANIHTFVQEEKQRSANVSIYPNPVRTHAKFELLLTKPSELRIEIIDSKGSVCTSKREFHHGDGKQVFHLNVEDASGSILESGFYYFRILTNEGIFTGKMVVSK